MHSGKEFGDTHWMAIADIHPGLQCTSYSDLSTDLSQDGKSLILWQQWRKEGVKMAELEGMEGRVI